MEFHDVACAPVEYVTTSNRTTYAEKDKRISRRDSTTEIDRECHDAEHELAARLQFEAANRHRKACQWLRVNFDRVTPEDLIRATLTDDPQIQWVRIRRLFASCGIGGEFQDREREDLIQTLAAYEARDEQEMRLLYQIQASNYMAMRCAELAMEDGAHPQAVGLHVGNFKKLSALQVELVRHFDAVRTARALVECELSQEVRIFN